MRVDLPEDIGRKVWVLCPPCESCEKYNEIMTEESIEACRDCSLVEVKSEVLDWDMLPDLGKTVFFKFCDAVCAIKGGV